MSDNEGPNFLNILLYMGAGAVLTYIWLNKTQTKSLKTSDIEEQYILQTQNNELLSHLKLLNETLNRRDDLLNEYQQTIQKQYQNIPSLLGSTINTELQQLALYLESINTQLEQINGQVKQILDDNHRYLQNNVKHEKETHRNVTRSYNDSIFSPSVQQDIKHVKPIQQTKKSYDPNDDLKARKNDYPNDKWSVKRGTDGRIKSLDNAQKV